MDCYFLDKLGVLLANMIVNVSICSPDLEIILAVENWTSFVVDFFVESKDSGAFGPIGCAVVEDGLRLPFLDEAVAVDFCAELFLWVSRLSGMW